MRCSCTLGGPVCLDALAFTYAQHHHNVCTDVLMIHHNMVLAYYMYIMHCTCTQ